MSLVATTVLLVYFSNAFEMLQIRCPLGEVSRPTPTCATSPCCRCCSFSCARCSINASYSSYNRSVSADSRYLELDRGSHARQSLGLIRRITDHTPMHTHGATSRMVPSNGREWVGFKLRTTLGKENTRKRQSFYFCVFVVCVRHFQMGYLRLL